MELDEWNGEGQKKKVGKGWNGGIEVAGKRYINIKQGWQHP